MLICINLYMEYSFYTILGTRFLFGEPNFSRLMNKRVISYDK